MIYLQPKRLYQNPDGVISPRLRDVITDIVTLNPNFNICNRRGTWRGSPFREIAVVPPALTIPYDLIGLEPIESIHKQEALGLIFDTICDSIAQSWDNDKFHVIFHSAGWDSRIISSAIRRLLNERRIDACAGILFLSNEWEAEPFHDIMRLQGWPNHWSASYAQDKPEDHFYPSLHFDTFWRTTNAPIPICGNLWQYLPLWAEGMGLIPKNNIQAYCGLWANETWKAGNKQRWIERHDNHYYHNINAAFSFYLPMEFPLSDLNVLKLVWVTRDVEGDELREVVAKYADPKTGHITNPGRDDRGHLISRRLRDYCEEEYHKSWYGKNVKVNWKCPKTSEFSNEWGWYGLASLCEELIASEIEVRAGEN